MGGILPSMTKKKKFIIFLKFILLYNFLFFVLFAAAEIFLLPRLADKGAQLDFYDCLQTADDPHRDCQPKKKNILRIIFW